MCGIPTFRFPSAETVFLGMDFSPKSDRFRERDSRLDRPHELRPRLRRGFL